MAQRPPQGDWNNPENPDLTLVRQFRDSIESQTLMRKITTGSLKANCLAILENVSVRREAIVITKDGKAVAKLVPVDWERDEIYNFLAGKGSVTGDVVSRALSDQEWGALE